MKKYYLTHSLFLCFVLLAFGGMKSFAQGNRLWATYYGGSDNEDYPVNIATDLSGNIFLTGGTKSVNNMASGGFQNNYGGNEDAYLVKFDGSGNRLWGTYYGGIMPDYGYSVATDATANVYLAGETDNTTGIATAGAFQTTNNGNSEDFLVKFDANGNRLWATYFGGTGMEINCSVTTDVAGNVYLAGFTTSTTGIASAGAFQTAFSGGFDDAYLVKFDSNGNRLWATYYGGTGNDKATNVATDASGNVYISGTTASASGIATAGGFQNTIGSSQDAFLAKFDPNGNRLWATYYGGASAEEGQGVACDPTGNVFLSGNTSSANGIASGGFQNVLGGGTGPDDAFLVKFDAGGNRLWATYYGGVNNEETSIVVVDPSGNSYLAGESYSPNTGNCIASGGFQNSLIGQENQFLAKFDPNGNRLCATYYGQVHEESAAVAVDGSTGNVYVAAVTVSTNGMASGGFQNTFGGGSDAYLVKFSSCTSTPSVTANPTNILCFGQCTGTGVATPSNGTSPYTYNWSPSGGTNATATGLCAGNYTVTLTDATSSTATATITITQPATALTATTNTTSAACSGNNGIASVTPSGGTPGYTYIWAPSAQTSQTATGLAAGNYTATVTDANGCSSTQTIAISSGSITATANSVTICAGQNATLTALGGTNYSWSNGTTTSSINITPTATTTYSVIVSSGSCADTTTATVTVNPSPSVSVSGNTLLCTGDATTLTASGGGSFSWSNGNTTAAINISPSVTTTYSVVASNGTCADTALVTVTVSAPPIANVSNETICSGQIATLTAYGGGNYSWSNGASTSAITPVATVTTAYSVTVSIGTCSDTASATVVVNPSPTAVAWSNVTITAGNSTTLAASGGGTYSWSNGANGSAITVSPLITTWYCVTVSNDNCSDTACATVYVEPTDCSTAGELYLPNAFSPNGDIENDVMKIYYGNMLCIKTYDLIIYNRWGEKVFETTDPLVGWDGSYKGKIESSAVFVYYMKATLINENEIIKKGNVSLIR